MSDETIARLCISAGFGVAAAIWVGSKMDQNNEDTQKGILVVFCAVTGGVYAFFEVVMTICFCLALAIAFAFALPHLLRLFFHVRSQVEEEIAVARGESRHALPAPENPLQERIDDIRRIGTERGYPEEAVLEEERRARRELPDLSGKNGGRRRPRTH